jgi:hypothetical protein
LAPAASIGVGKRVACAMGEAPPVEKALPVLMDEDADCAAGSKLEPPCWSLHAAAATVQTRPVIPMKDKRMAVNLLVAMWRAHGGAVPWHPGVIT